MVEFTFLKIQNQVFLFDYKVKVEVCSMETLALDKEKLNHIVALLSNIEYGSISIIVHDGQITQIESTEKKRFAVEKKKQRQNENVSDRSNFLATNKRSL